MSEIDGADEAWESRYAAVLRDLVTLNRQATGSSQRTSKAIPPKVWAWADMALSTTSEAVDHYERSATASTPDVADTSNIAAQRAVLYRRWVSCAGDSPGFAAVRMVSA